MKRIVLETKTLKLVQSGDYVSIYDKLAAGAVLILDREQMEQLSDLLQRYRADVAR